MRVATVCARFQGYPSDYMKNHDWNKLSLDYEAAVVLNKIDQQIEEQKYKALTGGKK